MSDAERQLIRRKTRGLGDALEIGTFCGRTTKTLLNSVAGTVYSVDPLGRRTSGTPGDPRQLDWIRHLAREYGDKFVFIPGFSQDLAFYREIDVLFIDGDHRFGAIVHDLQNFAPLVRPSGYLFLDDFSIAGDVKRAFTDWTTHNRDLTWEPQGEVGKLACFRRGKQT